MYAHDYISPSHRVQRKPTWGTCAGLILLAESANRTKKGGQDLIGGLDVRVNRNYFGRQTESFEAPLDLHFLRTIDQNGQNGNSQSFNGIFIRAPIVERLLTVNEVEASNQTGNAEMVFAPSRAVTSEAAKKQSGQPVEVMATLSGRRDRHPELDRGAENEVGDIVAVRQGNVFGTSFHPELTRDSRIHTWWMEQIHQTLMT